MRLQDQVLAEIDTELTVSAAKAEAADVQLSAAQGEVDAARVRREHKRKLRIVSLYWNHAALLESCGAGKAADAQLWAAQGEADAARVPSETKSGFPCSSVPSKTKWSREVGGCTAGGGAGRGGRRKGVAKKPHMVVLFRYVLKASRQVDAEERPLRRRRRRRR